MILRSRSADARRLGGALGGALGGLVGLMVGLVVISGCQSIAAPPVSTGADVPAPSSSGADSLAGQTYVALGDSYTAAPLNPLRRTPNGCLRSDDNYPTIVARRLDLDVVDVSCSGASTTSMFTSQHFLTKSRPPQLDALTPDTGLVTLGIGANDFAFFTHMMFDCLRIAPTDPQGAPCEVKNTANGDDRLSHKVGAIRRRVTKVVRAVADRAPNARILMVGYPKLLPASGDCRAKLPLAVGDYPYTRRLNVRLANAVRDGAVKAGAEYVDVEDASAGHDICSQTPWVAGIRGDGGRAMGLHPYPAEQRAVADLIVGLL